MIGPKCPAVDRPRVLVLDEELPWPANTGKRLRTLNLLSALSDEFAIDLLVHENGNSPTGLQQITARGVDVHIAPSRIPPKGGILFPLRVALSLARGLPYSAYSHYQSGFRDTLDALVRRNGYALIHCEWTPYALYARGVKLPVCLAAHNVEWLIWDRMARAESHPARRLLFRAQATLMRRFERRVFDQFSFATAVSDEDAKTIRSLGCREVAVVPNGVDTDYYAPPAEDSAERSSLVFTGSMDWLANQDAIRWFIREVHPLLRERTDYRLYVVGRTPPAWMMDSSIVPREVIVTGTVDDVRPWIAKASVYVVPLRIGGGSRLKILEALSMRRPVVSTTVGMEGLDIEPGQHLLVADTPGQFVDAICGLLDSRPARGALGRAGRGRVEARYRWSEIAPLQASLWRRAIEGKPRCDRLPTVGDPLRHSTGCTGDAS